MHKELEGLCLCVFFGGGDKIGYQYQGLIILILVCKDELFTVGSWQVC